MSHPIDTPTLTEAAQVGVAVTRGGKPVALSPSMIREMPKDGVLALAKVFPPERIAQLFEELTVATCITNGGREIPDNRTRLAATKYLSDQINGAPIQRQVIQQEVTHKGEEELMSTLESPAMLRALMDLIAKMQKRQAVDVESVPK